MAARRQAHEARPNLKPIAITHAAFAAFGVFWGAWAATLPALQLQVHASKATLGLALAALMVGSAPAMLFAGRAVDRWGGAAVAALCAAFAVAAALPALAHSALVLGLLLLLVGATTGSFDVAVNARAVRVEQLTGKRFLTAAHGFYSVGVLAGALGAGLARKGGASPEPILLAAAAILLLVALALALDAVAAAHEPGSAKLDLRRALVVLGLVGLLCAIVESGLENWSALFLERTFHAQPDASALAPGLFGGAMAVGRFSGHALDRLGDVRLFVGGALLAAAGTTLAAAAPDIPLAIAGVAAAGAGIALTIPLVFRAAGRAGGGSGSAIATATTLTYGGFLFAPTLVGGVAQAAGLRASFLALAGAAAVVAVAAPRVRLLR